MRLSLFCFFFTCPVSCCDVTPKLYMLFMSEGNPNVQVSQRAERNYPAARTHTGRPARIAASTRSRRVLHQKNSRRHSRFVVWAQCETQRLSRVRGRDERRGRVIDRTADTQTPQHGGVPFVVVRNLQPLSTRNGLGRPSVFSVFVITKPVLHY